MTGDQRWTDETVELVADAIVDANSLTGDLYPAVNVVLRALADAGLLWQPEEITRADDAWRHNAKLHNNMRRRIQQVATHAAAEQRTLSWVSDELMDILDDPQAWQGETAREAP